MTLVLVAVVPLLLLGGGVAQMLVGQRKAAVEAELSGTAKALQGAVDREFASQMAAIEVLTSTTPFEEDSLLAMEARVRQVLDVHREWLNLVLIDPATHDIVFSGLPLSEPAAQSLSPEAVDEVARTGRAKLVGLLTSGRVLKQPFVLMLAPVVHDKQLRYVVGVAMDPARLSAVFSDQGLDAAWTGAIIDQQMKLAGRSRDSRHFVGLMATPTLVERMTSGATGLFTAVNQEGQTVYTALSRSATTGWTVVIGAPASFVEGPVRALWVKLAIGGGLLIVVGLAFTGWVARGIVERRNGYEAALREGRSRLDGALAGADMATWEIHFPSGRVSNHPRWAQMLGYRPDELASDLEASLQALIFSEDLPRLRSAMELHMLGETPGFESEYRVRHKDGRWLWVRARGKVVDRDDAGQALRAVGTVLDISEHKLAALSAERERVRTQTILATAREGVHIINSDGVLVDANPAFLTLLGYDRSALGKRVVSDWDVDESVDDFKARNRELLLAGSTRFFEARHRRSDGALLDVEVSAARMYLDGELFVCAASRDISQRKRAEAELANYQANLEELVASRTSELVTARDAAEGANRAKGTFLANMSHELRTPLNAIMGLTDLALHRAVDATQQGHLTKSMAAARHLLAIINEILDFSKIEADALALHEQNFSLTEVFQKRRPVGRRFGTGEAASHHVPHGP
jgi:PAS domain S-box-containing protein